MLEELRNAARKVQGDRGLRSVMLQCKRLLSERGEANSIAIARDLVSTYTGLPDEQRALFFERLSRDYSPDPDTVLQSARCSSGKPV